MDFEEAIEIADDILVDVEDLPDNAQEFAESVREKVGSMRDWMIDNETVTEKMSTALVNIKVGVDKWLRR